MMNKKDFKINFLIQNYKWNSKKNPLKPEICLFMINKTINTGGQAEVKNQWN